MPFKALPDALTVKGDDKMICAKCEGCTKVFDESQFVDIMLHMEATGHLVCIVNASNLDLSKASDEELREGA